MIVLNMLKNIWLKAFFFAILFFSTVSNLYSYDEWTLQKETYLKGSISGSITKGYIFKVSSYEYYFVTGRERQRVRVRNPEVKIYKRDWASEYLLDIEGFDEHVICAKITDVIETQIDGDFEGWEGDTVFKLFNGQIWQQVSYDYLYHYAYMPEVIIYQYKGDYYMKVEDVDEVIQVRFVSY